MENASNVQSNHSNRKLPVRWVWGEGGWVQKTLRSEHRVGAVTAHRMASAHKSAASAQSCPATTRRSRS